MCPGNTNVIMIRDALVTKSLGTWTLLWFGHGCPGDRMHLEQERYSSLGMDALLGTLTL